MADRRSKAAQDRAQTGRQTTDELFNEEYARAGVQPFNVVVDRRRDRVAQKTEAAQAEEQLALQQMQAYEQSEAAKQTQTTTQSAKIPTQESTGNSAATKLVSRSLFIWMMGWHWWQWTTVQLVIGLLSVMFFGLAYGLQSTWLGRVVSGVAGAINSVTSLVGLDFSRFSPENMFWILYLFLLGMMWLSLFATVVVYMCVQNKALSGNGAGLKYGTLGLAIIGYAVPIANLFPWIVFYVLLMARYPK